MEKYVPMSDAELNKLKQKAEKEEKSENSAFRGVQVFGER